MSEDAFWSNECTRRLFKTDGSDLRRPRVRGDLHGRHHNPHKNGEGAHKGNGQSIQETPKDRFKVEYKEIFLDETTNKNVFNELKLLGMLILLIFLL